MTKTTEQEKKKAKEKAEKTHIDTEITHILTKVPLKKIPNQSNNLYPNDL